MKKFAKFKKFKFNAKKLLIVYSAIIIAAGIFMSTAVVNKNSTVDAAGWQIRANVGSCGNGQCVCISGNGCEIWKHTCTDGRTSGVCYDNPVQIGTMVYGEIRSYSSLYSGDCAYIQIDVNYPGSASMAGNVGAVTFYWDDFSVCGQPPVTPPPVTPPPAEEDKCPYTSTQARVKADSNDVWAKNIEIDCGNPFIVGSFHNGTGTFANNTEIRIFNPGSGSPDARIGNNASYQTLREGRYRVLAVTKNKSDGFYQEPECRGEAFVTCTNENPGFRIVKVATNDNGPYKVGDIVNFRVQITNTGNAALSSISYRDFFDNRFLRFVSVLGVSPSHPGGVDMTPHFTRTINGNITTFSSSDITVQMGDLGVGKTMYFDYKFIARSASTKACNDVFAKPSGLPEKQARDCVGIVIPTDF